jgi:hypothetical protein
MQVMPVSMLSSAKPTDAATSAGSTDDKLFEIDPPYLIRKALRLGTGGAAHTIRLAAFVILIGWLPLPLLVLAHDVAHGTSNFSAFATDAGAHARFLIAAPMFVVAEILCAQRLGLIARHFIRSGLVVTRERSRFDRMVASTRARLASVPASYTVVALAFALVLALAVVARPDEVPLWQRIDRSRHSPTPAGWWHVLVSLPLFAVLLLTWFWRLALWTRFLSATARLDLQIVPAHPDKAGGLAFVGYSLRAFSIVGAAILVVVAGRVANEVLHRGASLYDERYVIAASVAVVTALFIAPLFVFAPALLTAWRGGLFRYGALAADVGRQLEARWLHDERPPGSALASPDFSAAADLYQSVSNVYGMWIVPLELKSFVVLVASLLLPFVPVLLLSVPLSEVLSVIKSLLM